MQRQPSSSVGRTPALMERYPPSGDSRPAMKFLEAVTKMKSS